MKTIKILLITLFLIIGNLFNISYADDFILNSKIKHNIKIQVEKNIFNEGCIGDDNCSFAIILGDMLIPGDDINISFINVQVVVKYKHHGETEDMYAKLNYKVDNENYHWVLEKLYGARSFQKKFPAVAKRLIDMRTKRIIAQVN